jgi:carboxyl-terminal processing protease
VTGALPGAEKPSVTPAQYAADYDLLWKTLKSGYAYWGTKQTDWDRVRAVYRPKAAVKTRDEFVTLLERTLDELYDNHTGLNTNLKSSPRLVPTGLDVWAEWQQGRAVITEVRRGFSAEQAGLRAGMEIVLINNLLIGEAVARHLPKTLKRIDDAVRDWALRAVLAGTHDAKRTVVARKNGHSVATYPLDLPAHQTVDAYSYASKVDWKMLPGNLGYLRVTDLIDESIVPQFDAALDRVRQSSGLILDLREIPRGGSTDVAEPILGRFLTKPMGYQQVVPLQAAVYVKTVAPRGKWTYAKPLVVLVNHWSGSMAEGMTIGLDAMGRATVVGTHMARLNGGVFDLKLPNSGITVHYVGERLNHVNGSPREQFVPPVLVNLAGKDDPPRDAILEAGISVLQRARR